MSVRQNQIMIIQAYRYGGTWVFDDEDTALEKEAFVSGAPEMIDAYLVERYGDKFHDRDIKLLFSAEPFPGSCRAKQVNEPSYEDDYSEPEVETYDEVDGQSILNDESIERVPVDWADHPINDGESDNEGFIWGIEYWDGQDVLDIIWYDDVDERDYDLKDQSTDDWENFTWEDSVDTWGANQWVANWNKSLSRGWYETTIAGKKLKGWLCPATLLYFDDYPKEIYYSAEPLSEEDTQVAQESRSKRDAIEDAKWEQWRESRRGQNNDSPFAVGTRSNQYNVGSHVPGWGPRSYTPHDSPLMNNDEEE
tara:strand:- start:6091 stop:7014 length:924 start_codon:yes stop_codon:yes gene_type:complete